MVYIAKRKEPDVERMVGQAALALALEEAGWQVSEAADTETKAPGIDLLANMGRRWLAVEVKGYPNTTYDHGPKRGQPKPTQPSNQARRWFSHALLGMMLLRHRRPDAEIAIAFPNGPGSPSSYSDSASTSSPKTARPDSICRAARSRPDRAALLRTLGIDLSANPAKTGVCEIDWDLGSVRVIPRPATDDRLVEAIVAADMTGIDIPLGWPDAFVTAVVAHHRGRPWPPAAAHPPADASHSDSA